MMPFLHVLYLSPTTMHHTLHIHVTLYFTSSDYVSHGTVKSHACYTSVEAAADIGHYAVCRQVTVSQS